MDKLETLSNKELARDRVIMKLTDGDMFKSVMMNIKQAPFGERFCEEGYSVINWNDIPVRIGHATSVDACSEIWYEEKDIILYATLAVRNSVKSFRHGMRLVNIYKNAFIKPVYGDMSSEEIKSHRGRVKGGKSANIQYFHNGRMIVLLVQSITNDVREALDRQRVIVRMWSEFDELKDIATIE